MPLPSSAAAAAIVATCVPCPFASTAGSDWSFARLVRGGGGIEPVTELELLWPQVALAGFRADELDPTAHALELSLEQASVAIPLVEHPRHDGRRVTPRRSQEEPRLGAERLRRHDDRHCAFGALVLLQI